MKTYSLTALFLFFVCNLAFSQATINRGPYLQKATTSSITIQWRTDVATESVVWYGSSPTNLSQNVQNAIPAEDHLVTINGLNNASTYYYAVGDENGPLAGGNESFYFKTNPAIGSNTPFLAWVQGDAGVGTQTQRDTRDGFLTHLGGSPNDIDLMLMLGDNAYSDGKDSEYQDALFNDMYEDIMNKAVLYPTLGNHDSYSTDYEDRTGPFYDIFTFPVNGESGGSPSGTEAYYSYDYANTHFLVLNSEDADRSPNGEMAQWIFDDLSNTQQDWIIAYFHHPIYSGAHNNESDDANHEKDMRDNILPILELFYSDLGLYGHTHNYQRS
ncbi:MAG: purple acid phosphatase family protein, partial [Saprospiraceae bacterium]